MSSSVPSYLQSVRDQYEDFPYPPRDPEKELDIVIKPVIDYLDLIRFYCFGGKKDFAKGFRVLVAGGGTGDITMFLGDALKDTDAEIVHLDISRNSIEVAKKRAAKRGLKNITWVQRSLLELPKMPELGTFDYINCCGVLHHLADPDEGLRALNGVLKEDGAIGIMVYGKYGRAGIFAIQEATRAMFKTVPDKSEQVELCKRLLEILPSGNFYQHLRHRFDRGIQKYGDPEIFDLFLHSQDRAYSVTEIYEWAKRCKLHVLNFMHFGGLARIIYEPATFLPDAKLRALANKLPLEERQALAETLYGELRTHFFYVAKNKVVLPQPGDDDAIPHFSSGMGFPDAQKAILQQFDASANAPMVSLTNNEKSGEMDLQKGRYTRDMLALIDGKRTTGEIFMEIIQAHPGTEPAIIMQSLRSEYAYMYDVLHHLDWLLLRY